MERKVTQRLLSEHLYTHLDQLGFGQQRIWERIHYMNKCSRAKDISTKRILNTNNIEKIFVGSQREGTGFSFLNDLDILQINHDVMCKTDPNITHENGKVLFKLVDQDAAQGYFRLRLVSKYHENKVYDRIKYALVDVQGGQYLSSKLFMQKNDDVIQLFSGGLISKNTHYKPQEGPSIPKYTGCYFQFAKYYFSMFGLTNDHMDYVRAFPCTADHILQTWCLRERKHNWPSQKTIAHVMSLPAHVVPVGQTGSPGQDCEWRLCFTLAEIHLVKSFNNTQTKIFVLLKLIAKYHLKLTCKSMTSYVMKTVMLWLAEIIPQKKFHKKHLVARLYDALRYLQQTVQTGCLPSYMIPQRNLFAGRLKDNEREKVIDQIDFLLCYGNRLISDYYYKPNVSHDLVDKISNGIYIANMVDKLMACRVAILTTEGLAEYFTSAFLYKSRWNILVDNLVFAVLSIRTFGSHAVFANEKTLEISLNKNLNINHLAKSSRTSNDRNTATSEPELDLVLDEEKENRTTFVGVFKTLLMFFLMECCGHVGYITGAEVYAYLIADYFIGILSYLLIVFLLVIQSIYKLKRRYNKQTYIQNIGTSSMNIKIYIPKTMHTSNKRWGWVYSLVCVIYVIAVGIKYPAVFNSTIPGIFTISCTCLRLLSQAMGQINTEKIKPLLDAELQSVVIQS